MMEEICYYCRGSLKNGVTTLHKQKKGEHYIIEDVPVQICTKCGEKYFDSRDLKAIEKMIKNKGSVDREITVPVIKYKVA